MFTGIIEETGILMSVKGGLSGSAWPSKQTESWRTFKKETALPSTASALPHIPLIPAVFMRMYAGHVVPVPRLTCPACVFVRSDGVYGTVCRNYGFVINNQ